MKIFFSVRRGVFETRNGISQTSSTRKMYRDPFLVPFFRSHFPKGASIYNDWWIRILRSLYVSPEKVGCFINNGWKKISGKFARLRMKNCCITILLREIPLFLFENDSRNWVHIIRILKHPTKTHLLISNYNIILCIKYEISRINFSFIPRHRLRIRNQFPHDAIINVSYIFFSIRTRMKLFT